ncbi:helix-hairpin-helix domain-containing protein [Halorussus marinus]|uniref:helix-hairpin-helix domain-containing protein n=1 Tax=Halorussus marinus TaxID=2505976 RepID=UPI00106DDB65|nr:helix-hairpin-helix domain-containing protein [Halorussus marinus]
MGLLTKLKSLLGLDDDRSQVRRTDSGVTIEREPEASPDTETESAVKGVDAGAEESFEATDESETDADSAETGISTEDVTTAPAAQSTESQTDDAAEPAEAVQPSTEAAQPTQTAGTEPEPTPEPDVDGDDEDEATDDGLDEEATDDTEDEEVADDEDETIDGAGEEPDDHEETADEQAPADEKTDDEAEADDEPAASDEQLGEGEPLDDIKGIGSAYAERLNDAGVGDIAELARADPEQLAAETGVSEKRIVTWIDRAKAR